MNKWFLMILVLLPWGLAAQTRIGDSDLKALLVKNTAVVVDVRTAEEYATGHLPGAKLLPFDAIYPASASKLLASKNTQVVVYCHSGRRSGIAAQTLAHLGYTKILDFGAISNWSGKLVQ